MIHVTYLTFVVNIFIIQSDKISENYRSEWCLHKTHQQAACDLWIVYWEPILDHACSEHAFSTGQIASYVMIGHNHVWWTVCENGLYSCHVQRVKFCSQWLPTVSCLLSVMVVFMTTVLFTDRQVLREMVYWTYTMCMLGWRKTYTSHESQGISSRKALALVLS